MSNRYLFTMSHSPFPVLIGLILFTIALAAAFAAPIAPLYQWVLLVLAVIAAFTYATAPLIVMGRLVKADRLHAGWALIAVMMQGILWGCVLWFLQVAFSVSIDTGAFDLGTLERFDPAKLAQLDNGWYLLGGYALYTLENALVYNAVLMATYLRGIVISVGTDLLRVFLLGLWAVLLHMWR